MVSQAEPGNQEVVIREQCRKFWEFDDAFFVQLSHVISVWLRAFVFSPSRPPFSQGAEHAQRLQNSIRPSTNEEFSDSFETKLGSFSEVGFLDILQAHIDFVFAVQHAEARYFLYGRRVVEPTQHVHGSFPSFTTESTRKLPSPQQQHAS